MVQAQDVLGLGSEARMNDPGRATGSWRWQLEPGALTAALARRMREATEEASRIPEVDPRAERPSQRTILQANR